MGTSTRSGQGGKTAGGVCAENQPRWSRATRVVVSLILILYLFILILGPLSNPVGSEHLAIPLAKTVSPVHQAMFMGHGYRFFGPDPSASHLIEYSITQKDGSTVNGHFPDRETTWPRLLYHRWFMLSETVYAEHSLTPIEEDFQRQQEAMLLESRNLKMVGSHDKAAELIKRRNSLRVDYDKTRERIALVVKGIARELLKKFGSDASETIELFVRERRIPYPADVQAGRKLDDPVFLAPEKPISIGVFKCDELIGEDEAIEPKFNRDESQAVSEARAGGSP